MLLAKGFQQCNNEHERFLLYHNKKKTAVRTYFSHGQRNYEKQLLAFVKREMHLPDWDDFDDFMDCDMTGRQYLEKMIRDGHVIP